MKYYEKLRALREDNDLTQTDIANILKMKQQQYSNYERGVRMIPLDYLSSLCKFYGVSADYILGLPKNLIYPER
ncbi:MAG: helix-turn-helix domain-containing protein [Eubacterium sp.]|nr:helix-turn-helix domain-containing protein [Eubacterium sp.]